MRRTAVALAALAVLAGLPATARATPRAWVTRFSFDRAVVVAADHPQRPRVLVSATVVRATLLVGGAQVGHAGADETDVLIVCLSLNDLARSRSDHGCVVDGAPRPATDGAVVPEGATIRARVPSERRRGGWIEADLRLTGKGDPWPPTVTPKQWVASTPLLGAAVPTGCTVLATTVVGRDAVVSGTVRSDRAGRTNVAPYGRLTNRTSLVRTVDTVLSAHGDPDVLLAAVERQVRAATIAAAGG